MKYILSKDQIEQRLSEKTHDGNKPSDFIAKSGSVPLNGPLRVQKCPGVFNEQILCSKHAHFFCNTRVLKNIQMITKPLIHRDQPFSEFCISPL